MEQCSLFIEVIDRCIGTAASSKTFVQKLSKLISLSADNHLSKFSGGCDKTLSSKFIHQTYEMFS